MRRRFFALLVGWTAAAVLGVGVLALRMAESARRNVRRYHEQLAEQAAGTLDRFARELNSRASVAADLDRLPAGSPLASGTIQAAIAGHSDLALLALVSADGRELARSADARLFPGAGGGEWRALASRARQGQEPSMGAVELREGTPVLPVAYPLRNGELLLMAVNLGSLFDALGALRVGLTGRVLIAGADGRVLGANDPARPDRLALDGNAPAGWLDAGGFVGAYRRCKPLGWFAATIEQRGEAFGKARGFLLGALVLFAILAGAAAASAGWLSRQIVLPLADIMEGANRSSQNIFNVPVAERGWPELRALASRFNHMMAQLKSYQDLQVETIIEEKSKVDALVYTIPEGLLMADLAGNVLFSNQSLYSMTRAPQASQKKRHIRELITDPKVLQLAVALARRESRWSFCETEVTDGSAKRFLKVLGTVIAANGKDSGFLLLFRDVTVEKQIEQMKEEFFHSIIHDLRNPLGVVQIVLDLTKSTLEKDPKLAEYQHAAARAATELQDLMADVLDLAKLESGSYRLSPEPKDVAQIARECVALMEFRAKTKNLSLSLAPSGAPAVVACEGHKVARVLCNLIGNAVKFTPHGGAITVRVDPSPQEVRVAVSDTGPGIPPDKLKAVFEKFKQLDLGAQERSGFGLGLTICKRFVELHGGRIWAESPPGQGASFVFTLPLRAAAAAKVAAGAGLTPR